MFLHKFHELTRMRFGILELVKIREIRVKPFSHPCPSVVNSGEKVCLFCAKEDLFWEHGEELARMRFGILELVKTHGIRVKVFFRPFPYPCLSVSIRG